MHRGANRHPRITSGLAITFAPFANVEKPIEGRGPTAEIAQKLHYFLLLGQCEIFNFVNVTHQMMVFAVLVQNEHYIVLQSSCLKNFQGEQSNIGSKFTLAPAVRLG